MLLVSADNTVTDVSAFVGDYRLEKCPVPEVGEEEVLVRVLAVGVCSSDAKCFAGAAYYWGEHAYEKTCI
jgi:NADPH:quinone reductase-like Zn-dependent oxidoreductase